jgi:hypothetical protein
VTRQWSTSQGGKTLSPTRSKGEGPNLAVVCCVGSQLLLGSECGRNHVVGYSTRHLVWEDRELDLLLREGQQYEMLIVKI